MDNRNSEARRLKAQLDRAYRTIDQELAKRKTVRGRVAYLDRCIMLYERNSARMRELVGPEEASRMLCSWKCHARR